MNQLVTNKANSKTIMRQILRKRKSCLMLKAAFLVLCSVLFTLPGKAQVSTGDNYQVYMKEGNSQVARGATNVKFYDDHGPSYASDGNTNYWDRWYVVNKHYTYVFRPKTAGDKIKVTFKRFTAYEWSDTHEHNCHEIGEFSLRINDDVLKVYNSDGAIAANLIAELTGTVAEEFTFMADGPMTFEFISNEQYREEGWGAEVTAVTTMTVQAPLIQRSTCSDDILLIPTVPDATLYYTTNGSTPTTSSTQYTGPIEWPANSNITVKAIAVLDGNSSAVTTKTFNNATDRMPTMDGKEPTIERVAGTNTVRITCPSVPTGMNETFYVVYTTNNTEPTATNPNGTKVFFVPGSNFEYPTSLGITVHSNIYEFECNTPGSVVRAKTFAYSCSNLVSNEGTSLTITTVYVDAPTISFTTTNPTTGAGQATIGNIMSGAMVYYTTDGSQPTTSSSVYSASTPIVVTPGQTVRFFAHRAGSGYTDSPIVSETYIPSSSGGGSTVYGGIVLLDDREDHSWSYYSKGSSENPIHSLKPADMKITYFGYGPSTMTSSSTSATPANSAFNANVSSSQVAVNHDAPSNQFVYLKTLENANPEGTDGSNYYPYTMIPNPFQVRPLYNSSRGDDNSIPDGNATTINTDGTSNADFTFNSNATSSGNDILGERSISPVVRDGDGNIVGRTDGTMIPENDASNEMTRATNTLIDENFDGTGFTIHDNTYSSSAWYTYKSGNGNNWNLEQGTYAHSGNYCVMYPYSGSYAANCYLVSEPFSVSASMTQLSVSLYERVRSATWTETFEVFFVKASDVTTVAAVASATKYNAITSANYTNTDYTQVSGSNTNSALKGQSVRVVVHCTSAVNQYNLYIDDITVTETTSSVTTYTVTYNANGGTGTMTDPNSPYTSGSTVTVLANAFTAPSGMTFSGWNTAANGSGTSYAANDHFNISANTTLYAQWAVPCDYSEDFENVSGASSGYSAAGSLPTGWDQIYGGTVNSTTAQAPHVHNGSSYPGPGIGSGYYLGFYGTGTGSVCYAIMPALPANEAANHISFKYRYESTSNGTLSYGVIDGTDASTYVQIGTCSNSNNNGLVDVALNVSQTTGKRIAFCWSYSGSSWYTAGIDDICVMVSTPTYSVTYNGNGNTGGSVPTDNTAYNSGAQVTVLGNTGNLVLTGYTFNNWNTQADGSGTSYSAGDHFNITANITLYAQWTLNTYTVTAAAGTGINTAYVAAGTSFSGTSATATVTHGGSATFQATVANGYVFDGWYDGMNDLVSTDLTCTVNNITGPLTLTARGLAIYTITVVQPASGGALAASESSAFAGTTITVSATPAAGYLLDAITVTPQSGSAPSVTINGYTGTFTMPASNVTVTATFTESEYATVPFTDDFESDQEWQFVNGTTGNIWTRGTAANNGGSYGLYITNTNGTTGDYGANHYIITATSTVYAYQVFTLLPGEYRFQYDWRANGESNYDYLRVALVPASVELEAGNFPFDESSLPTGWIALDGGSQLNQSTSWNTKTEDVVVNQGGNYKLVFAWRNDHSVGNQPPAAIDNVSVTVAPPRYNITVVTPSNGSLSSDVSSGCEGDVVTLTASPNSGYSLGSITVTGSSSGRTYAVSGVGSSFTFNMPNEDVTVSATFFTPNSNSYRGFYAWRVKRMSSGMSIKVGSNTYTSADISSGIIIDADQDIQFVAEGNSTDNEVDFEALWAKAYVTTTTSTSGLNANVSYERNFMVLSSSPSSEVPKTVGSGSTTTNGQRLPIYVSNSGYPYSVTQQFYTPTEIGTAGTITKIAFYVNSAQSSNRSIKIYLNHASSMDFEYDNGNYYTQVMSESYLVYSGTQNFNATDWKTITLDTPFVYDGTSYLCVSVIDATGSYMSTPPTFRTYSATNRGIYGAFNNAPNLSTYNQYGGTRSSYINQMQFTFSASTISNNAVPMTITTYNPDGTGGSSSVVLSGDIYCGADLKFENIKMNNISTLSADGHNLVVGRGVTKSGSGYCANVLQGISGNMTSNLNMKMRIESGSWDEVYFLHYYGATSDPTYTLSGSNNKVRVILGSDYDRANKDNDKLDVYDNVVLSSKVYYPNQSYDDKLLVATVKSGKFLTKVADASSTVIGGLSQAIYISDNFGGYLKGKRELIVEGGDMFCIAGGTDASNDSDVETVRIRVKGGTIRGSVYGAAQWLSAAGNRKFIFTGGTVNGWIAGGCNGTDIVAGETYGNTNIYFGGNSRIEPNGYDRTIGSSKGGNIFGAGSGIEGGQTVGQVSSSTVVIADNAQVARDVYGGGNYGYVSLGNGNKTDIYVLGGTVSGNVFGGSNQQQGQIVNIWMTNGTVTGNIYGGSNSSGTINDLATIEVSGGTVNNVFGGGYGVVTNMEAGTLVNINGGTINNNVYGGGEEGKTKVGTTVNITGGTMKDVYGAGKGDATATPDPITADVNGQTIVNVSGGILENVYGGGENGDVKDYIPEIPAQTLPYGFEDGTTQGWSFVDNDGDGSSWRVVNVNDHSSYQVHGGDYLLCSTFNSTALAENWLISPRIELGGDISFWVARINSSSYTDYYSVYVSTDYASPSNFTHVLTTATVAPTSYSQVNVSLSGFSGKGYVAIVHTALDVDQGYIFIDDVTINTPTVPQVDYPLASTVTVEGGTVNHEAFGGGKMGKTDGDVVVNMFGGNVKGSVFGGALGDQGSVFVGGQKTVNMTGGHVFGNLYGGSRFANDALTREGYDEGEQATTCEINMSAGKIDQNLYGAGYLGRTYGSINVYLGAEAIDRAPNHTPIDSNINYTREGGLNIEGSIYAGSDWGDFQGGTFGAPTVSGQSNVYVDGTGYNTTSNSTSASNYMKAGVAIFGCGTSCDAGSTGRNLIVRNYGTAVADAGNEANPYSNTTRQYFSIQRFKDVTFDNAHLLFIGQGKVNSLNVTEKYGLYEDEVVHLTNGSTMMTNVTCTQIKSFQSVTCPDVYAASPVFTPVAINGLGSTGGVTDNKIRVNGGSYIEVKYVPEGGSTTQNFDFEDGTLPSGWTKEGNNTWNVGNGDGYTGTPAGTHGGNYNALITHGTTGNITYLVTSPFNLGEATSATLDFWYINRKWSNDIDDFAVCYRVNGGAWTELWSTTTNHESWTEQSVTLTGLDDNYQIGFKFTDGYGYGVGLDDINLSIVMDPQDAKLYRELKGWAHMMSSINDDEATCAYARPKQSQEPGNIIPSSEDNPNDGGFVSYDGIYNQYTAAGALVSAGNSEQIRYENHTPNMRDDSKYFRIWRYGGNHINIPAVFDAHATGTAGYRTVDVTVTLPPFRSGSHYYRFETTGEDVLYLTTEYGSDVMTYNAACYNTDLDDDGIHGTPYNSGYMYYQNGQQLNQQIGDCPGKTDIDDNPNVNFGLVIMPDNTMVGGTNYIICDASETYLAGLDRPFTCTDNTMAPQMTFRLTYNNELSSNMTWDPMKVKLVQCDASGHITDYVTVELTVVTSTTITQDFHTDVYAIMDQHGSLKDTYTAKLILPRFDVLTAGANSTFTVTGVSFVPDVLITPDHTAVDTIPISSDGLLFHEDNFGLAIDAADTYDNSNVWYSLGDRIDIVNPNGKVIGMNSGRNEVGIDITLFYTSRPEGVEIENESHMGQVIINVEFDNYLYGTGTNHTGTLRIIVDVYRRGEGDNFYVDGIDGKDETGYGRRPDKPAATVNYIFNRCNYTPGGNIFVVNTVTVDRAETWNGARFNSVNMYRYPGMHLMSDNTYGTHENNGEFTGKLVEVANELTMRGIVMDGMYEEATAATHNQHIYPSVEGDCNFDGESVAPLINVADGGRINLKDGVVLKNNDNTSNANYGGAMSIEYGGTARMNYDAKIVNNYNVKGGGVWVDGSLIVSDTVEIFGNKVNPTVNTKSNVWLTNATEEQAKANVHYKVVQIGTSSTTDEYGPLYLSGAAKKIGVGKDDWDHSIDGYMPVVYSEDGTEEEYLHEDGSFDTYLALRDGVFIHDGNKFKLEEYTADWHYLYWLSTWVTYQDHVPTSAEEDGGVAWAGYDNITTPNQLAWVISLVNGENNNSPDEFAGKTIVIKNDIDLSAHIWVPIGDASTNFKGTLQGNGHVISGLKSSLVRDDMGMFGITDGATIKDAVVVGNFNGDAANLGTVVGTMKGGVLKNVESAGTLEGRSHTENVGGLVGKHESGTIHSSFALNTVSGATNNTVVGGLVGTNGGDLYNSYANVTLDSDNTSTKLGGLVGINSTGCHVGNCYVINPIGAAFAFDNQGTIEYCYGAKPAEGETVTYVENGTQPAGHGTYDVVKTRKAIGYMYDDNTVEALTSDTTYVRSKIIYDAKIKEWPGLLSTLNQWVTEKNGSTSDLAALQPFTVWYRPVSSNINGDLPILGFPMDNSMADNDDERGKFLWYSAYNYKTGAGAIDNGLDKLLTKYNENSVDMFLYGNAVGVEGSTANNQLFINEDAVLTQKKAASATDMETIEATVGVTFDNSCRKAHDYYNNILHYDWHFMSSPLSNAMMGMTYGAPTGFGNPVNVETMVDNYFPNGLPMGSGYEEGVKWDLYSYYEPQYHWINLKRSTHDHWHIDGDHDSIADPYTQIVYINEDRYVPGKGYMMGISQDSYMNKRGALNNGNVTIQVTNDEQLAEPYNRGWNLVGNPYQAYMNLADISSTGKFYIYDADLDNYVPVAAGQSKNPDLPSALIHPHQGFFMYTSTTTDFTFNYEWADTTKQTTSYFRGLEGQLNYPLVNIFAENERGNHDLTVIEFNRPDLGGATKVNGLRNADFKVAASYGGQEYGILFTPEGTEKVPVHFRTDSDGTFTFRWRMHNGNFTSLRLIDNKLGVDYDMLANNSYTFEASADDYASRFYITYACTGVDEEYVEGDDSFAYFDGSEWVINGKGYLDVIDVTGRVLFEQRLKNEQNRVNLDGYAKGVYLLRMIDNKIIRIQKIVVK